MSDEEFTPEYERGMRDKYAIIMRDSLLTYASAHSINLHGLLDAGYGWFEWLETALGAEQRDFAFWNHSHGYADRFADRETEAEAHLIRRTQVAQYAIKLLGRRLYPTTDLNWEVIPAELEAVTYDPTITHWERTWPTVQLLNGQLVVVYFVAWYEKVYGDSKWQGVLHAISIEHLTEFDWLERANMFGRKNHNYSLSEMLFDFIHEGQGVYIWKGGDHDNLTISTQIVRAKAEMFSKAFEAIMDARDPFTDVPNIMNLRAIGGEYHWLEHPELRDRFGGGDGKAINKHSTRIYQYGPNRYMLDRNLSIDPPLYTLYKPDRTERILTPIVKVDGEELWGDGLSWKKAEAKAKAAVEATVWSRL